MKIDIRDNIEPALALQLVTAVVAKGKISKGENGRMYYCWVSEFEINGEKIIVGTRQYRKDDCFAVYKPKLK